MEADNKFENMRSKPRFKLRSYVNLSGCNVQYSAHLLNISQNGALVAVLDKHEFLCGDKLELEIELTDSEQLQLQGQVIHIKKHYLGLNCEAKNLNEQQKLVELITSLKQ